MRPIGRMFESYILQEKYFVKNIKINPTWHSQPSFYAKTGRDSVDHAPNPNPNPNWKVIPNSRFEPKSKKYHKSKSKIDISLPNNNIFSSFYTNHSHMLCYMFTSPLVFIEHTIIELSTRSTIEILNRIMILSKSNIFNSLLSTMLLLLYWPVHSINDPFLLVLAKLYKQNMIIRQVQILLLLRKRIIV